MKAIILAGVHSNIALAGQALQRGDVVGMPTETVYGLAGAAFQPEALARIFDTKERPTFDPLIIHIAPSGHIGSLANLEDLQDKWGLADIASLSELAKARARQLIEKFWPGPLTLVLPKLPGVPDLATAGLGTVALRMPKHPVAQALIQAAGTPLAAPSANRFGRISPTCAQDVFEELGDRINWILDGGSCQVGLESTVISIDRDGSLSLLRPGGIPRAEIEAVVSQAVPATESSKHPVHLSAPGMLESHYAPRKPLFILPKRISELSQKEIAQWRDSTGASQAQGLAVGLLLQSGDPETRSAEFSEKLGLPVIARSLSPSGDLSEVARKLFSEMRGLDASEVQWIAAEPCMETHGLGYAIRDRLQKASFKKA